MVSTVHHPLDPATADELGFAVSMIRKQYPDVALHFKVAGLEEPPKKVMVKYLEAEHAGRSISPPNRWIFM